jgi:hypothetical protein
MALLLVCVGGLTAQQASQTEVFWAHNFQFFAYDYRIGATLQRESEFADFYVENARVISSTVDATNQVIYIGTANGGVFKRGYSDDSWVAISVGLGEDSNRGGFAAINDLVMNSAGTLVAGTDEGIYTLTGDETRWRSRGISLPVFDLMIVSDTVYAALGHYLWDADSDEDGDIDANLGVRRSFDGGISWTDLSTGLPVDEDGDVLPVLSVAYTGSGILATTSAGLYQVANGDNYWRAFSRPLVLSSPQITVQLQESNRDEAEQGGDWFRWYYRWLTVSSESVNPDIELVITVDPAPAGIGTEATYSQWLCPMTDGILGDAGRQLLELGIGTSFYNVSGLFSGYEDIALTDMKYGDLTGVATIINPKREALLLVDDATDPEYAMGGQWAAVTFNDGVNSYKWSVKIAPLREPNKDQFGLLLVSDNQVFGDEPNYEALNLTGNLQYFSAATIDLNFTFDILRTSVSGDRLFGISGSVVYESTDKGLSWSVLGDELSDIIFDLYCADDIYLGTAAGVHTFNAGSLEWELLPYVVTNTTVPTRTINHTGTDLFSGGDYGFFVYDSADDSWIPYNLDLYEFVTVDDLDTLVVMMDSTTPADPSTGIYETITNTLGVARLPDIDNDQRLSVLLHNVHDRGETWNNTSNGTEGGIDPISGYVRFADNSVLGRSNRHDMIYLDTKDGGVDSRAAALAHQIVRLMMFTSDYDEERWVLEAISYIGEKLCGYELPSTWVDFAQKATAAATLSLNSQWTVNPNGGSAIGELHTKAALWMTYLMENLGGIDFITALMDEPANGVTGIGNTAAEFAPVGVEELTFSDIYTSWAIASAINDVSHLNPVTGFKYGYQDSSYTDMLDSFISGNADSIGIKVNFLQPDDSMDDYAKIQLPSSYSEGLNNWATIYRSFFWLESTGGPKAWAGKTYHFNGADDKNFRLWMFKHKTNGGFDITELTDMLNDENELQFDVLAEFEPNTDTTAYEYDNVIIGISNQTPLGGSARFVQTTDITVPQAEVQVVHHAAYPEFVDIYVYANEHIHADVPLAEMPVVYLVEYYDTTLVQLEAVEMELFQDMADTTDGYSGSLYQGSLVLDADKTLGVLLYTTQDLAGNNTIVPAVPFTAARVVDPGYAMRITSSDKLLEVAFPEQSLGNIPIVSVIGQSTGAHAVIHGIDPAVFGNALGMYLVGPAGHNLNREATLKIDLRDRETEEIPGIYLVEGSRIMPVKSVYSSYNNELTAGINKLGIYLVAEKSIVSPDIILAPATYRLSQNYPNPFNPTTSINYSLPVSGKTIVKVYNLLGMEIVTLVNSYQSPGDYRIQWNGIDNDGKLVSSGVYLYRIDSGSYQNTRKMVFVK